MWSLQHATIVAKELIRKLSPYCDRIHLAGSTLRQRSEVKDIEIVCQPIRILKRVSTLFEAYEPEYVVCPDFVHECSKLGTLNKGKFDGRYLQMTVKHFYGTINMDLFMPEERDYYRQLVIRTGSLDYVIRYIATGWRKLGWVGTEDGLRRIEECMDLHDGKQDKNGIRLKPFWKCTAVSPTLPPYWKSEAMFFEWLGLPYVEPKYRNV